MKVTTPCMSSGSLWEPDILVERLKNNSLVVSFNLWNESTFYKILVNGFPNTETNSCYEEVQYINQSREEDFHHRTNVTFLLQNVNACCQYSVQIQPFFKSCRNDCLRHTQSIPCPVPPSLTPSKTSPFLPEPLLGEWAGEGQELGQIHPLYSGWHITFFFLLSFIHFAVCPPGKQAQALS
uniref:Uncharacterized protein n=1 Tax=Monodelphis domestica TaxID=13616 RepID=A0A5F8GEE8_MONDO